MPNQFSRRGSYEYSNPKDALPKHHRGNYDDSTEKGKKADEESNIEPVDQEDQ